MHTSISILMDEHRVIERVLDSLETFVADIQSEGAADRKTVSDYADFFRNFADKCHHGKEEDLLFAKLTTLGFPKQAGPIAVMLADHVKGREHVSALAKVGAGEGPLSSDERNTVCSNALSYLPLLRSHIMKEDQVLYPMALRAISPSELDELAASYEAFERDAMGEDEHERFHRLAGDLVAAHPPSSGCDIAGGACAACAGR